ncbi:hypothetical protein FG05_35106 [Fusarium graminearum]|nr:hypothetical protein FG05_35106 [Fusarium graminearum]
MPSKTDVSDVPSANATHGSATPPYDKDTKTPSNGTASSHYPVAETEDEKKKRRDELLLNRRVLSYMRETTGREVTV